MSIENNEFRPIIKYVLHKRPAHLPTTHLRHYSPASQESVVYCNQMVIYE